MHVHIHTKSQVCTDMHFCTHVYTHCCTVCTACMHTYTQPDSHGKEVLTTQTEKLTETGSTHIIKRKYLHHRQEVLTLQTGSAHTAIYSNRHSLQQCTKCLEIKHQLLALKALNWEWNTSVDHSPETRSLGPFPLIRPISTCILTS